MIYGYIKVYNDETDDFIEHQKQNLLKAGATCIIMDSATNGNLSETSQIHESHFIKTINSMKNEDILIIPSLDRLGQFLSEIFSSIEILTHKNIHWCSLAEHIDSKLSSPHFWYDLFKLLVEYERKSQRRRVVTGLNHSSKKGGRPTKITDDIVEQINKKIAKGESHISIIESLKINKMTFYRTLKKFNIVQK